MFRRLLLIAVCLAPAVAHAHGRPPLLRALARSPADPDTLIGQATWGFAISHDDGASWRWSCAAALGVDARNEDPQVRIAPDGAILAGTFSGLLRSEDGGCSWIPPEPELERRYIPTLEIAADGTGLLVASRTGARDTLYRTTDGGRSWTAIGEVFEDVLVASLLLVPGRPELVYAGGYLPLREGQPRAAFALRSEDGGASWQPFELQDLQEGERQLTVLGLDPGDPAVLYGQVLHFNGDTAPERIVRSPDGGETWETVHQLPFLGGLVVRADGAVVVGSRLGGLYYSADGLSFETVDDAVAVSCLMDDGDRVWMCADEAMAGAAIARSSDGRAFTPLAELRDIDTLESCPLCTAVGEVCPAWEADVIYDLGLDLPLPPEFDPNSGTGAPRDAGIPLACLPDGSIDGGMHGGGGGCGCTAAPRGEGAPWGLTLLCVLLCRKRDSRSMICRR